MLRHSWRGVLVVSVTGLLASTSANWGSDENRDPLAAADNASAEAIPIPTPANMDLFISLTPVYCGCPLSGPVNILVIFLPPLKQRGPSLRQGLT